MKKYFSTGIVILLPVLLTLIIVAFLVNFLTNPFLDSVTNSLDQFKIFQLDFFLNDNGLMIAFVSRAVILLNLFFIILVMGWIGKFFLVNYFIQLGHRFLKIIPYINKIYRPCQEVINSLLSTESKSFSAVVLVSFPNSKARSIGFVTKDSISMPPSASDRIAIFIPCTPNPSIGYMMMQKREEVIFINMKTDEAMKFILSCGVVTPDFNITENKGLS